MARKGQDLWAAIGPPSTVGLAIYDVQGGTLRGTWYPFYAPGYGKEMLGTEDLAGPATLGGSYKITSAKAPKTQAAYAGTVTLSPLGAHMTNETTALGLAWDLGAYKYGGVGLATKDTLAVCSAVAPEFAIVKFKLDSLNLVGDLVTNTKATGFYTLVK